MHCANYSGARLASMCWKDHLMPKKGEKPVELWTNQYCGHTAMYYMPEQLEPCTEEYYKEQEEAYKERRRAKAREYYQLQKERKREAAERRRTKPRTSWQWLSEERRKIRQAQKPSRKTTRSMPVNPENMTWLLGITTTTRIPSPPRMKSTRS